jgi:hypothetical protein
MNNRYNRLQRLTNATRLKESIKNFLGKPGLTLREEKTKISNRSEDYIKFLGICLTRLSQVKSFGSPRKSLVIQSTTRKLRNEADLALEDIRKKLHAVSNILKYNRPYPRNI